MAAQSTTDRRLRGRVEQPPRTVLRRGERVDISHLTGDAFFEAITSDEEQWDYARLSAETGRTVIRLRKWVVNARAAEKTGQAEDDKTFVVPDGIVGGSPWWYAGHARSVLMQIGVMTRDGVAIPYRPTGRPAGARDLAPRRAPVPTLDTAVAVYREYKELTGRRRDPLNDRQARTVLAERHGLNRSQVARRIKTGMAQVEKSTGPVEVDKAVLQARLVDLTAEQRAAGYSESGADDRARTALAAEVGLTRRQLAGYLAAAETASVERKTG